MDNRVETPASRRNGRSGLRWVALCALTVLFGMQTLRTLLPLLVFIFRDRFGWHAVAVGSLALTAFVASGLAPLLRRYLGPARFLWVTLGGVGLCRLAFQLWTGDPLVDAFLALAAAILLFQSLPVVLAWGDSASFRSWLVGGLMGLALDTALHGLYGTFDMSWRSDHLTHLVVAGMVLAQWGLLVGVSRCAEPGLNDVSWQRAWPLMAVGPFLFLELQVVGNLARSSAATGWRPEVVAVWVLLCRGLALWAVIGWLRWVTAERRPVFSPWLPVSLPWAASLLALLLMTSLLKFWPQGWTAAGLLLVIHGTAVLLLVIALRSATDDGSRDRPESLPVRLAISHLAGLMMLALLIFLYYGSIDIRLPFAKEALLPAAAMILGLAAWIGGRRPVTGGSAASPTVSGLELKLGLVMAVLIVLPLAKLAVTPTVTAELGDGFPVRLMTYNLHCGVDPLGHLGLDALAVAIEAERPDVVVLQEVSRGWLVNGSVDMPTWLSQRLGMPFVFAPTADPLWGNAVLSRRPIENTEAIDLPTEELLIRRGLLAAHINLGEGESLNAIVTHFHDPEDGGAIRELESQAVVDFWRGRHRTALAGDLNAQPGAEEIEVLRRAGLQDVFEVAGAVPGETHPATEPRQRIDYIWTSPDLRPTDVKVPWTHASDHLPVVATLDIE